MSLFENRSNGQQGRVPSTRPRRVWWPQGWNLASGLAWTRGWTRNWVLILFLVFLCIPIAAVILGYLRRPSPGNEEVGSSTLFGNSLATGGAKPKPAPGKPFSLPTPSIQPQPVPQSHAPAVIAPQSPATPQLNLPGRTPAVPAQPQVAAPPPASPVFVPQSYAARHDKHFGDVCSGQLTLNNTGLVFTCPDDPGENIQVPVHQIASVDDNGIRLSSGKKYHFTIPGMSKDAERAMFADWLGRAR